MRTQQFHFIFKLFKGALQMPDSEYIPLHLLIVTPPPPSLCEGHTNLKACGGLWTEMALAEAQQGISLPTIVLIDENMTPYTAPFTLLQSLKFLSDEVPRDVRTVI